MSSELKYRPPPLPIDIGPDPIDRMFSSMSGTTYISQDNPANASGILHTIKIWAASALFGLVVGTFYTINADILKCRDSELVPPVAPGSEQTITGLSIAVEEGDYIGCYFTTGGIERDLFGFVGVWEAGGNHTNPGDEDWYLPYGGAAISLYGIGEAAA